MDRNYEHSYGSVPGKGSLSARRAWIEIQKYCRHNGIIAVALRKESVDRNIDSASNMLPDVQVALRKESVDRNHAPMKLSAVTMPSLSARRAWIEIRRASAAARGPCVALRKESVDRNVAVTSAADAAVGRSPQGERG